MVLTDLRHRLLLHVLKERGEGRGGGEGGRRGEGRGGGEERGGEGRGGGEERGGEGRGGGHKCDAPRQYKCICDTQEF